MSNLTVTEAIQQRSCVRAFSDQPVERTLLEEILVLAGNAPSGSNLQPWKVYAVTGDKKEALSQAIYAKAATQPQGETPDIRMYPKGMGEPWRSRRAECGEIMYNALSIARDDTAARFEQGAKNLVFFGAPVGLIITMDRSLSESQIMDIGIFIQSIMLLAQERGLSTCPQAAWQMWAETIRDQLKIPENEMVMVGMSLGYANTDDVASNIRQPRLPGEDYVQLFGFDD